MYQIHSCFLNYEYMMIIVQCIVLLITCYCYVPQRYSGQKIHFQINEGSNPYWFAFLVEYEDGDGDLGEVSLKQVRRSAYHPCS